MFFGLNSWLLALVLAGILFGATFLGLAAGRSLSHHRDTLRSRSASSRLRCSHSSG